MHARIGPGLRRVCNGRLRHAVGLRQAAVLRGDHGDASELSLGDDQSEGLGVDGGRQQHLRDLAEPC